MATLTPNNQLTLKELAKRTKDQNMIEIAEVLHETNEIMDNAVWQEANGVTTHTYTQRTSLPTGGWRQINAGVTPEASTSSQFTEELSILEAYSEIDKLLVDLAPDKNAFRSSEDLAFVEGLGQKISDTLIYGDKTSNASEIMGLANRYNTLADASVFGAGGTGSDLTSMWVVQWDKGKVSLVYPKGHSSMGINVRNLGEDTKRVSDGTQYQVYTTLFQSNLGLVVKDPKSIARVCNLEGTSTTLGDLGLDDYLIQAINYLRNRGQGNTVIYCNRTIMNQFDVLAKDKTNVAYTSVEIFGKQVTTFRGVPVRLVESIIDTEDAIA